MQLICYLQIVHFDVAIFFMHITNDFNDIIYKLIQKSHISHKQIGDLVETLWKHLKKLLVGKYTYKCQKYTIAGMVNDGRVPTRVSITGCFFFFHCEAQYGRYRVSILHNDLLYLSQIFL